MELLYSFAIVFLAAVLKGLTGFGFAMLSLPFLLFFHPVKFIIPVITLCNLFSSLMIILTDTDRKLEKKFLPLPLWGIAGNIAGIIFLKFIEDDMLKIFIAAVLIILSGLFLIGYRFRIKNPSRAIIIAGLTSGSLGGSTSVSGPPLVFLLTSLNLSNKDFRYIFAWFCIAIAVIATLGYLIAGYINLKSLKVLILFIPILFAGTIFGQSIIEKISVIFFYQIMYYPNISVWCHGLICLSSAKSGNLALLFATINGN